MSSCYNNKIEKIVSSDKQFSKISSEHSNIAFVNTIEENNYFNFLNYSYIYNGGGVAAGDINNDGLVDLYFTANQTPNKLYLNKGGLKFEDISIPAKVDDTSNGWTTGVTMIDINNDGFLDIYVCKSGLYRDVNLRKNLLFVNQNNNTFKEEAENYGLASSGFSTQAYFIDFDKDGDLDMYLVNHRPDFNNNTVIDLESQKKIFKDGSDQLFRNDSGKFVNTTKSAGLENKAWGLSATIGDFNNDSWPDIYVANDFLEPDFLYINNKNGTFSEKLKETVNHISSNSMGSDWADINNDLYPDLLVLDMTPEDHVRSKSNMPSMSTENFNHIVNSGYHYQYMQNTLQLNNANGTFSEIAMLAGIAKTDWSWAPLIADFDNDGLKDVFVTNGVLHELNNQDFRNGIKEKIKRKEKFELNDAIDQMPSVKLSNYIFKNTGNLVFKKNSSEWGLSDKSFSSGAVYADLDNDGDLDLVTNNMNDEAGIYLNASENNFIQVKLLGESKNKSAIGASVFVFDRENQQLQELNLSRGFQSSVDSKLTFGLGDRSLVDSIIVHWPDGKISKLNNVDSNQLVSIEYSQAKNGKISNRTNPPLIEKVSAESIGINFKHKENDFNDFSKQILLPHSQSKNGPFLGSADVNNDGLDDFFVGGALGQTGELFVQQGNGSFKNKKIQAFILDKKYEDLGVLFLDVDNDNDQDLYIVSGGAEFDEGSSNYQDRLYLNNGYGDFEKSNESLPIMNTSGQVVISSDVDADGDLDLFIGGRNVPNRYPMSPNSYFLINENGVFENETKRILKGYNALGMVTSAIFTDYDSDGDDDLMIVGEWSKIEVFENNEGEFTKASIPAFENTNGLWFSIAQNDVDNDGDMDYFIGNLGLNSKFKASIEKPFHIYSDDFDSDGNYDIVLTNHYKGELVPLRGKECMTQQMPEVSQKFKTYESFANASLVDVLGEDKISGALHLKAEILASVFVENKGKGEFSITPLPNQVQIAPILKFDFKDLNNDGFDEVFVFGNMYNTEVETVRYDASYGAILEHSTNSFNVIPYSVSGLSVKGDAKDSEIIKLKSGKELLIISRNNDILESYYLK